MVVVAGTQFERHVCDRVPKQCSYLRARQNALYLLNVGLLSLRSTKAAGCKATQTIPIAFNLRVVSHLCAITRRICSDHFPLSLPLPEPDPKRLPLSVGILLPPLSLVLLAEVLPAAHHLQRYVSEAGLHI